MLEKFKRIINTEDKKRLLSNFSSLALLQAANFLLPLISMPYLVRVLGTETYGLVMFVQALILYFNILVDFGFDLSATREISVNREQKRTVEEVFNSVLFIKFFLMLLSFSVLCVLTFSIDKLSADWELVLLSFGIVVGQAMFPVWFFQGMEQMKYITVLNVSAKLIFVLAIIIFVNEKSDFLLVPIFNSIGFIVAGLASLYIVRKQFKIQFKRPDMAKVKHYFKDSSQFFLSRVSVSIYTASNVVVLGFITNNTMVGYYSIAEKLYTALQSLYHPLVNTLYPYVANSRNISLFAKLFKISTIVNFICALVMFVLADYVITILFGDGNIISIEIFRIFLISSLLHIPAILLGYPYLAALGYANLANKSVVLSSIIHLVGIGVLWGVGEVSVYSVAFMVLATEAFLFTVRIYYVNRANLKFTKFCF